MRRKKIIFFGTVFSLFLLSLPLSASLLVSPVKFVVKVPPDKPYTDAIRVRNMKNAEANVKVYASDFILNVEGALVFLKEGTLKNSLSRWIRVNPTSFKLKPNEEKWVRFTVRLPKNTDGELHGMIFFQTIPSGMEEATGKQVFLSTRIGAVVYASLKGEDQKTAEISDFFVKENVNEPSLEYSLILHNKGKIHIRPKGKLNILDSKGKKLFSTPFNEERAPVLRENLRIFKGQIGENMRPDSYRVTAELDYGGKANLEGEKPVNLFAEAKIEEFEGKIKLDESQTSVQPIIVFSVKARGIHKEGIEKSSIRIKNINGDLLTQIPLKIKISQTKLELEGEWNNVPGPGMYFAELFLFNDGMPLISYTQFVVEE